MFLNLYELVTHNQAAQFHAFHAYLFLYRISSKRKQIPVCIKTCSPPTNRDRAILNAKKTEHHPSIFPCKTFTKCCAVYPRPRMCSWHWLGTADRCQLRDADCIQTAPNMWNRNFHKGLISKPFQNERWHCTKPRLTSQLISFKRFGNQKRSDRRLIKDNSMTFSNLKFILHVFHVQSQIQSCILFKCLNMNIYTHTHTHTHTYSKIRPGQPWVDQKVFPGRQDRLNSAIQH